MQQKLHTNFVRWITLALILFLIVCIFLLYSLSVLPPKKSFSTFASSICIVDYNSQNRQTVILDAGHGGIDSGAQSANGIKEKDLNLIICQKISKYLSCFDLNVVLTRTGDELPNLVDGSTRKQGEILSRIKIAEENKADIFLSVHMNSFPRSECKGAQVFYSNRNKENEVFALTLQESVRTLIDPLNNRQAKNSDLIFLLSHLKIPAALLECGFLTNAEELNLLQNETFQNKFSFAIAVAIADYLENSSN